MKSGTYSIRRPAVENRRDLKYWSLWTSKQVTCICICILFLGGQLLTNAQAVDNRRVIVAGKTACFSIKMLFMLDLGDSQARQDRNERAGD
ncbi:hypothetical protein ACKVWC_010973 [Pyricularia oryzae]